MLTPFTTTVSPGLQSSQLPPCSAARSTTTEPGFIPCTMSAVMRIGARRPGISAVVMTASDLAMWRLQHLGLLLLLFLGDLFRVAALGLRVLEAFDLDELGAQALHLLFDRFANVERFDHRTEASRGGDGLEPGHTGAEDQHLGRRNGASRGHQHREELGDRRRGEQNGVVARPRWSASSRRPCSARASCAESCRPRSR